MRFTPLRIAFLAAPFIYAVGVIWFFWGNFAVLAGAPTTLNKAVAGVFILLLVGAIWAMARAANPFR